MKAITLLSGWAWLIANGHETIETRLHGRFKCLVGETIAIHAGKSRFSYEDLARVYPANRASGMYLRDAMESGSVVKSAVVCVVDVDRFIERLSSCHSESACRRCGCKISGLVFGNVRRLWRPFFGPGKKGIWNLGEAESDHIMEMLRDQDDRSANHKPIPPRRIEE